MDIIPKVIVDVVDTMIDSGEIAPEDREWAINQLRREMRNNLGRKLRDITRMLDVAATASLVAKL